MSRIFDTIWLATFAAGWLALAAIMIKARRRVTAMVMLCVGAMWLFYSAAIAEWVGNLGSDSLIEAQDFDITEALDYVVSLRQVLRPVALSDVLVTTVLGLLIATTIFGFVARWSRGNSPVARRRVSATAFAMVVAAIVVQIYPALSAFQSNSEFIRDMRANFRKPADYRLIDGPAEPNDLNVVVYIGESTSALNMSIYGYPRPTTPDLSGLLINSG